ncbi:MAG TPA: hypothetical protein VGX48_20480 [Pyrinomonadaceae bacterium]|jgi:hypothetical protein|nr:hypothetical protein [Pyrinomonadaceae bacterium]
MKIETSLVYLRPSAGLLRKLILSSLAASLLALPLRATAGAQTGGSNLSKPRLISNAKKYSDAGQRPATGRSGSASLTARALLGRDGQTAVELTTGSLDAGTPAPGNILKAQLKPLNNEGEAQYARNYVGLTGGGHFAVTVNDLRRGQQVQAQASVGGIDSNRTDVVTVVETVKLRPDLAAASLVAPAKSPINTSVNMTAVVRELNGDVGARANVVLYVDGAEADRADGVWVDAGGTVSAAFTHTFASEGVKQLEVKVERVTPGDYRADNNSAKGSIEIVSPRVKLSYYAFANDIDYSLHYSTDYQYNYNDGTVAQSQASKYLTSTKSHTQDIHFYGWSYSTAVKFPFSASITELSDGAPVVSASFDRVEADYAYSYNDGSSQYEYGYAFRQDNATGCYLYVNTSSFSEPASGYEWNTTQVTYTRHAGDVTYHSSGSYRSYYAYQGETVYDDFYSFNYDSGGVDGVFKPFGTQYGLDVTFTGADGTAAGASPRMQLVPTAFDRSNSFCWEYSYSFANGRNCYDDNYTYSGKDGYAQEDLGQ